jgi:L-malate glycosyltransferase
VRPGVLIVTPWYRPALGGVAEVAERLRSGLLGAGVEAHLLVLDEDSNLRSDPVAPNLWRMRIPVDPFVAVNPRALAVMMVRGLPALLRLHRFLRVHRIGTLIAVYPIEYAWALVALQRLAGARLIVSLHGTDIRKYPSYTRALRWLLRRALHRASAVTVPSASLTEAVRSHVPEAVARVRVVRNGIDVDAFTPPPPTHRRRDPRPTVLHVSNFAPVKRTGDLVDALADPRFPSDARLVFVGDGPELERTRAHAEALGVGDRVEFVGAQADVRPFLWDADVVAVTSEYESSSLVLLEAMACGVPWVSTPWGIAAEMAARDCGLHVPVGDPERLAIALAELLADPDRRREMGGRGRQIAVQHYGLHTYIQRHLELIGET